MDHITHSTKTTSRRMSSPAFSNCSPFSVRTTSVSPLHRNLANNRDTNETTVYVEEALHRLVETYYKIGLVDEAEKYANVLGYNYQSSKWYEQSYKIFNKKYATLQDSKKDKKSILKRFKSIFK